MIEAVQQHFVNPVGLAAILALIPLIIFYLVKPKPQREVMPSMTFFTEEQKSGKIKSALDRLRRNRMLLLHIFIVSLIALAIANPLVPGLESDGRSVIIIDNSASMHDNRQEAEKFALKHVGEKNTIITASNPEVVMESASTQRARNYLIDYRNSASETDLVSALQLASNYRGKLVLASDMDHTASDADVSSRLTGFSREIEVLDLDHRNSHGFVGLKFESGKPRVTVQNFLNRDRKLEIQKEGGKRIVNISALSTRTVKLDLGSTQEVSLPPDEFAMDNTLHVSMPENRTVEVAYLGEGSRYFRKAIQLIDFTAYRKAERIAGADTYFIGENFRLDSMDRENLREELEKGASFIIEDRPGIGEIVPVENSTGTRVTKVQISTGLSTNFNSTVRRYDVTGEALAQPEEALVLSEDEDVLLYNVDDRSFGQRINYPIFWKKVIGRMNQVKLGSELNLRTGQEVRFENRVKHGGKTFSGLTLLKDTGFYRGQRTYSANLLDSRESSPHISSLSSRASFEDDLGRDPARKYLSALLALIASLEITYLSWKGELK